MDQSACRHIVEKHIRQLKWELGLGDWDTCVIYVDDDPSRSNPDWSGWCTRRPAYRQARIFIDPAKAHSEAEVLDTLRHELLHVVLAPFDALYAFARRVCNDDEVKLNLLADLWETCAELGVGNLERLCTNHGRTCPWASDGTLQAMKSKDKPKKEDKKPAGSKKANANKA